MSDEKDIQSEEKDMQEKLDQAAQEAADDSIRIVTESEPSDAPIISLDEIMQPDSELSAIKTVEFEYEGTLRCVKVLKGSMLGVFIALDAETLLNVEEYQNKLKEDIDKEKEERDKEFANLPLEERSRYLYAMRLHDNQLLIQFMIDPKITEENVVYIPDKLRNKFLDSIDKVNRNKDEEEIVRRFQEENGNS